MGKKTDTNLAEWGSEETMPLEWEKGGGNPGIKGASRERRV